MSLIAFDFCASSTYWRSDGISFTFASTCGERRVTSIHVSGAETLTRAAFTVWDFHAPACPAATSSTRCSERQLAGIAADDVATVAYLDASGNAIATAPVTDNLFASSATIPDGTGGSVEALDTQGEVISDWKVPSGGTGS